MSVSPSRRRLLQAALLSPVVAACTSKVADRPVRVDPDVAIRAAAIARERDLLARYAGVGDVPPSVARRLAGIRAEHEQHLAALVPPAPSPGASALGPAVIATASTRELVTAERLAAAGHAAAALAASRPLAVLLASLAGSEASHAVVLT